MWQSQWGSIQVQALKTQLQLPRSHGRTPAAKRRWLKMTQSQWGSIAEDHQGPKARLFWCRHQSQWGSIAKDHQAGPKVHAISAWCSCQGGEIHMNPNEEYQFFHNRVPHWRVESQMCRCCSVENQTSKSIHICIVLAIIISSIIVIVISTIYIYIYIDPHWCGGSFASKVNGFRCENQWFRFESQRCSISKPRFSM